MDIHLQTLILCVKERALFADEAEWASMVEAFRALTPEHRVLCWREFTRGLDLGGKEGRDKGKLMHKHFSKLVLDCFC